MITTVSLVNIHHHAWLQFFFLVMRTSNNLLTRDVSIFTYITNCQPQALVSAKIVNILRSTLLETFKNTI